MEYKFSLELREKLIEYFSRDHQVDISQEEADEFLDSMADLFSAFRKRNPGE